MGCLKRLLERCRYKFIQLTNKKIARVVFGIFLLTLHDVWNEVEHGSSNSDIHNG